MGNAIQQNNGKAWRWKDPGKTGRCDSQDRQGFAGCFFFLTGQGTRHLQPSGRRLGATREPTPPLSPSCAPPGLPAPRHKPAQRQHGGEKINKTLPSYRCKRLLIPTNLYAVLGCSLTTIWVTRNSFSSSQASCCSAPHASNPSLVP